MIKLHYSTEIVAPAEKVFRSMLGLDKKESYEFWTKAFNETSTFEGTWNKGEKILFVGESPEGKRGGMVSEIAEHIPNKFISIRHYGILDGETEIISGPEVEKWAGGHENYTFEEKNGITTIKVDVDSTEDFKDYFDTTWPLAFEKLKEIVLKG